MFPKTCTVRKSVPDPNVKQMFTLVSSCFSIFRNTLRTLKIRPHYRPYKPVDKLIIAVFTALCASIIITQHCKWSVQVFKVKVTSLFSFLYLISSLVRLTVRHSKILLLLRTNKTLLKLLKCLKRCAIVWSLFNIYCAMGPEATWGRKWWYSSRIIQPCPHSVSASVCACVLKPLIYLKDITIHRNSLLVFTGT